MTDETPPFLPQRVDSRSGLSIEINANGSIRRFDCGTVSIGLFLGNEVEGGPANLYLRRHGQTLKWTPLLGPASPTRSQSAVADGKLAGTGSWLGIQYTLTLALAQDAKCVVLASAALENTTSEEHHLDLTYGQDVALALVRWRAAECSSMSVSTSITRRSRIRSVGWCWLRARIRESMGVICGSRSPRLGNKIHLCPRPIRSSCMGSATRAGDAPAAIVGELPGKRLQHEHLMAVARDTLLDLGPKGVATAGFYRLFVADHRAATSAADLAQVEAVLALAEARVPGTADGVGVPQRLADRERVAGNKPAFRGADPTTLFSNPRLLEALDLDSAALDALFGSERRHEERDTQGALLSFFHGDGHHVALPAKELTVLWGHGHILRSGVHVTPDESALTSTVCMNGVFHLMVTQDHVSINRFLSTVHTYLTLFRSHGQRVFIELDGQWHLLGMPSAFEMSPRFCRWIYRHKAGEVHVCAGVKNFSHELRLDIGLVASRRLASSSRITCRSTAMTAACRAPLAGNVTAMRTP